MNPLLDFGCREIKTEEAATSILYTACRPIYMKVEYLFNGGAKKEKEVEENENLAVSNKGE